MYSIPHNIDCKVHCLNCPNNYLYQSVVCKVVLCRIGKSHVFSTFSLIKSQNDRKCYWFTWCVKFENIGSLLGYKCVSEKVNVLCNIGIYRQVPWDIIPFLTL